METSCLYYPADQRDGCEWVGRALFLTLLLNPDQDSRTTVATGASRSNLFFSRMFGASLERRSGLGPRDAWTL
ncbi:MAG: hypothetical protein AUG17_06065 [Crenarchaeota archaeon 13_1_20CM_2_53_14]|nr:MAG: hypothetical protein AUG17_06065 [Crenarchaeota archaeon 13_1_20CM_2_53_14]